MKTAVITGASSGIGRATAVRLAERDHAVVLTYNGNAAGAQDAVTAIEAAGGQAVALQLDVGDSATFANFAEQVATELRERWDRDRLDVLVNNAGFGGPAMFGEVPEELYDRFHRVLLKGPYFLTQALLPLLADGGAIVNTASSSALPHNVEPGYSAYATMKGGLIVLSRYLAKELSVRGIRVNVVSPGPTRTGMSDAAFQQFPEILEDLVARTALGRIGEADDVGKVIAALCSQECAWITGEHLDVSGGFAL